MAEWISLGLTVVAMFGGLIIAMVKAGMMLGSVNAKLDQLCEQHDARHEEANERFGKVEGRVDRIEDHLWKGPACHPAPKGS